MLVLKPIDRLFDYGNTGLAMMPHRKTLQQIYKDQCYAWESNPEFDKYDFDVLVNNTGLMVFSDSLSSPEILKNWCFEKMMAWSKVNTSIQPIMTLMFQEFDIQVEEISRKYNCPLHEETSETVILHTWGYKKFWDGYFHPVWDQYYLRWLDLGGDGPISWGDVKFRNNIFYGIYQCLLQKVKNLSNKLIGSFVYKHG
jgi:hypothetical protein